MSVVRTIPGTEAGKRGPRGRRRRTARIRQKALLVNILRAHLEARTQSLLMASSACQMPSREVRVGAMAVRLPCEPAAINSIGTWGIETDRPGESAANMPGEIRIGSTVRPRRLNGPRVLVGHAQCQVTPPASPDPIRRRRAARRFRDARHVTGAGAPRNGIDDAPARPCAARIIAGDVAGSAHKVCHSIFICVLRIACLACMTWDPRRKRVGIAWRPTWGGQLRSGGTSGSRRTVVSPGAGGGMDALALVFLSLTFIELGAATMCGRLRLPAAACTGGNRSRIGTRSIWTKTAEILKRGEAPWMTRRSATPA
jgi:hypothetical protein